MKRLRVKINIKQRQIKNWRQQGDSETKTDIDAESHIKRHK